MKNLDKYKLINFVTKFKEKRIAVLGDLMIDQYIWGSVKRISPEAPVPIVETKDESISLGGAANVANNLQSLGISVIPIGVIGDDDWGRELIKLVTQSGFAQSGIFTDPSRPTTLKSRIIAHSQHVVRVDRERKSDITASIEQQILSFLEAQMANFDALIFEDYNKGLLTSHLIRETIALAKKHDILTTVDPKFSHFHEYSGVTLFKPNRKEAEEATAQAIRDIDSCIKAAIDLRKKLHCQNILITLGEEGMVLVDHENKTIHIPTQARKVHDVSGAGDTVISTLTACLAAGASVAESAHMANFAASVVIAEIGAVPINPRTLQQTIMQHYPD